jgi:CDP-diacylglycerol---glycerol-3-phosphate 3-phosphatidyltransferase
MTMNVPNQLTLARLALTALMVFALEWPVPAAWCWALIFFVLGAITDFFDGWLARRHGLVTPFGALMDPLADKVLTGSAFIVLASAGHIAAWVVAVIMAREFLVTGLRLVAASQGAVLPADRGGKWKTGAQIALIVFWMLWRATQEAPLSWAAPFFSLKAFSPNCLGRVFLWLTLGVTVTSGVRYLWVNRHVLREK